MLRSQAALALDTETTGLRPWQGDRLFSIIVATAQDEFYFNFNSHHREHESFLERKFIAEWFGPILADSSKTIYKHNAKFDMAMLYNEGITEFDATIIDNEILGRLYDNARFKYSLDALAGLIGHTKGGLKEWLLANGYWEWRIEPGEEKRSKHPLFDKAPLEHIVPYGCGDGRTTFDLAVWLLQKLKERDDNRHPQQPSILQVISLEAKTTKELFHMERHGVLLDREYTAEARAYEEARAQDLRDEFKAATGVDFVDSAKCLSTVFKQFAPDDVARFRKTEKGNLSFKDDVIATFQSPLAQVVREHRDAYKRAGTYFSNYELLVDDRGRIHPNFRQGGTKTGRLSASDPNVQNVTKGKDKESRFPIRRCFIPPPEFYFVGCDYGQAEYRLMLDYAGEKDVIRQVLDGVDVHQATANLMGVDREPAKTINFMLLYGGGPLKLAHALKIPLREAKSLRELYFDRLPKVTSLIKAIIRKAETDKVIYNWYGRVYRFPDKRFAYKAPNYLIQGGCADIMKVALTQAGNTGLLRGTKSSLVLTVHDELDFYIHESELELIPKIRKIMVGAYPHRHLPFVVDVEISRLSWGDLESFDAVNSAPAI